ncbi:MAG: hypothetical protein ABJQ39_05030 [Winogradskyella arenosi]
MKSNLLTIIFLLLCVSSIHANVVIINGLTHSYSGVSGQIFYGEVLLANTSSEEQRITFSLSEALYSCESGRVFSEGIAHQNSSTAWFKSSVMDKTLAAKERYVFKYSISVPNDDALKGSFWTTLMINVEKPIREEVVNDIGLDTKIRYAIRLLTDVNFSDEVNIDFKDISLKSKGNGAEKQLDINIYNENIFIENVKLALELYDANGNLVLEVPTKRLKVFPNVCRVYSIDLEGLPIGEYQCVIVADSRDEFLGTNFSMIIE